MTLRHLRVFVEVCKYMNMTQASKALYISQPAISKTISELEAWYDAPLFERINKTLYLTDAGKTVREYATYILDTFERMDAEAHQKIKSNVIHVGASVTLGTSLMYEIVASFKELFPDIKVYVRIENSRVIQKMLVENQLDMALIEGSLYEQELQVEEFHGASLVIICGEKHPLFRKPVIVKEDYEKADFIVREKGSSTRNQFDKIMKDLNINWYPVWECSNTQAIKNAVAAGLGLGVLSRLSVRRRIQTCAFRELPLFGAEAEQTFSIVYHEKKLLSDPVTLFKTHCVNILNSNCLNPPTGRLI